MMRISKMATRASSNVYVQLVPLMVFCFGMLIAAIPMMLA
jgi:hypothetical protein